MSGLEIAGVVLAVIPVFQLALRIFQGHNTKTLVKYQLVISSISRRLDFEHAKLHSTCSKLLQPLLDEEAVAELLEASEDAWKDAALVTLVRTSLGDRKFNICIETLEALASSIIALREELGLQDVVSPSSTSQTIIRLTMRGRMCLEELLPNGMRELPSG
jgi:hypothetical protein